METSKAVAEHMRDRHKTILRTSYSPGISAPPFKVLYLQYIRVCCSVDALFSLDFDAD